MARAYVGTSGFSYPEWKGSFYPADLPIDQMLPFYGRTFPTVELNNTFYRYPQDHTLAQWAGAVPPEFRFAVKAHRRITHLKRLVDIDGDLAFLFDRLRGLGSHLGPILFQFPPSLRCDLTLLTGLLTGLRPGGQAVVEFRHATWRQDPVYRLLTRTGSPCASRKRTRRLSRQRSWAPCPTYGSTNPATRKMT